LKNSITKLLKHCLCKFVYGPGINEPVIINDGTNGYYYVQYHLYSLYILPLENVLNVRASIMKFTLTTMENATAVIGLVSVGIWLGIGLSNFPKLSAFVYLVTFFLIPLSACVQLLIQRLKKKHKVEK